MLHGTSAAQGSTLLKLRQYQILKNKFYLLSSQSHYENLDTTQWSRLPDLQQSLAPWICKQFMSPWSKFLVHIQLGSNNGRSAALWKLQQEEWPSVGFESQDEIASCPPSLSYQIWVICSYRFAIPFSSLQGLSCGASVPKHPAGNISGFRSCKL